MMPKTPAPPEQPETQPSWPGWHGYCGCRAYEVNIETRSPWNQALATPAMPRLATRDERGKYEITPARRAHAALSAASEYPELSNGHVMALALRVLIVLLPRIRHGHG